MEYIVGEAREQLILFSEALDDIIGEENPVRFIDAYIEKLDLRELHFKVRGSNIGRPAYSEKLLLKIYIYGYMNMIRSSRRLENECKRNIELMWLANRLAPDFKTIANFRKDNKEGIKQVHKEFLKLCHKLDLLSFKVVGIDGTKIRGQNSNNNVYKRDEIEKNAKQIEDKIEKYLSELDKNDISEKWEYDFLKRNIEKKLERLKSRKEKIKKIKEIFEENPEVERYFGNDFECEFMKDKGCVRPGYNVQSAVDEKSKLIVAIDVVRDSNDSHQLINMSDKVEEVKKEVGFENVSTIKVADPGYYSAQEIMGAEDKGDNTYVSNPEDESKKKGKNKGKSIPSEEYSIDKFKYDKKEDIYICPEGERVKRINNKPRKLRGRLILKYICRGCKVCDKRFLCTKSAKGRMIQVYIRKEEMDKYKDKIRSEEGKKLIEKRKEICEHPFGTIKRSLGYNYFLLKGREKVLTEFSMISLVYNIKRVLNMFDVKKLLEAI